MHLLTKIFIVLVSLLTVLLVPLVVVYAHNEDSFKGKYQLAEEQTAATNIKLRAEQTGHAAKVAQFQSEMQGLTSTNDALADNRNQSIAEIRSLKSDLKLAETQREKVTADISTLSAAVESGQQIMQNLLQEVQTVRSEALSSERRVVQLDEALRDLTGQLDVAVAARRAMQEELQQMKEETARLTDFLAVYRVKFGSLESRQIAGVAPPQIDLDATVLGVERGERTLAEINAGSRDGVQAGWVMSIARRGQFVANLRIIAVDVNRATGVVELEDAARRGTVQSGDRVMAVAGQS